MKNKLGRNEKIITIKDVKGNKIDRIGKLVKTFENTKSKYKYKVRIAPRTFIYTNKF